MDVQAENLDNLRNQVREAYEEVLEIQEFNNNSTFFELGGHSLALGKLSIELENKTGFELGIIDLIRYDSVNKMVEYLEKIIEN